MVMNMMRELEESKKRFNQINEEWKQLKAELDAQKQEDVFINVVNVEEKGMACKVLVKRSEMTIDMVKMMVMLMKEIPKHHQTLLFNGRLLEDTKTIADYNIQDGNNIDLVLCPPMSSCM